MDRSEVNEILRRSAAFIRSFGYVMPPFADWETDRMRRAPQEAPDIITRRLGWDVTDFGQGHFDDLGLLLFTVRNGDAADLARGRIVEDEEPWRLLVADYDNLVLQPS